jgi:hypothetical protein
VGWGMGMVKFFKNIYIYFGGKCLAFGAIIFKEKFQKFRLIFSPKLRKKSPCFYT